MQSEANPVKTVAVILAGGTGTRVGLQIPKQLIKIAGKPVIEHTIAAFDASPDIDEIIIMMTPGYLDPVLNMTSGNRYPKVTKVLPGGSTRNETTKLALAALGEDECKVLFHDAVRPLVSPRTLRECVAALDTFQAVDTAIPSADTIVEVNDRDEILAVPDRSHLRRGQTPQGFHLSTIRRAYEIAWQDPGFAATDDCSVVLKYLPETKITVVEGTTENMKVTEPIDVFLVDKLFQLNSSDLATVPKFEWDTTLMAGKTVVVFGGSYGIGEDIVKICERLGAAVFAFSRSVTHTNVQHRADIKEALATAHAETGRIDVVVNTAGVLSRARLTEIDDDALYQSIEVNYTAPILIAQESHRYLEETRGHLLLFTSSSYTRGRASYALYSSAKAGVVNLTQALADEWSGDGIKVNCINPDRTATPMRSQAFGKENPETLLTSEQVAVRSVQVLLSSLTGQVFDIRKHGTEIPEVDPGSEDPVPAGAQA